MIFLLPNDVNFIFLIILAVCKPECQNEGDCIKPNICHCNVGFTGTHCENGLNKKIDVTYFTYYSLYLIYL